MHFKVRIAAHPDIALSPLSCRDNGATQMCVLVYKPCLMLAALMFDFYSVLLPQV